jgi:CheY-like chemotaxis protein/HPt (histidine-containing phosphotransfer) domain-containing protein
MKINSSELSSKSVSVLIAEDNPVNMLLLKSIIENVMPHATIIETMNGKLAVEKFKSKSPDIVFMDIRMPEKNGYEATAEIRNLETTTRTPIIALTAGTAKGEREKCLEAGMDDYISKPIVQDSIEKALKKWLLVDVQSTKPDKAIASTVETSIHYDEAELRYQLGNNQEVLLRLLESSKISLDNCFEELKQFSAGRNFIGLVETAHKIKGVALSSCFNELAKLASQLEETEMPNDSQVELLLTSISSEIDFVKTLIG